MCVCVCLLGYWRVCCSLESETSAVVTTNQKIRIMPSAFPATVAEREAELVALQSAFDEYIASSRELEEELDAELAKMRKFINLSLHPLTVVLLSS